MSGVAGTRVRPVELKADWDINAQCGPEDANALTDSEKRLNRDCGRKRWGDEGYAMEELVAELGSAFLCADLGIDLSNRTDHASYIDSWLRILRGDRRAIFQAAAMAERAGSPAALVCILRDYGARRATPQTLALGWADQQN